MSEILIFGGAFDPPHCGHQLAVEQALKHLPHNQVWIMPSFGSTFGKHMSSPSHRITMSNMLVEVINNPRVSLSTFEIDRHSSGSTYETYQRLPKNNYSFLIGSDQLPSFTKWGHWQELLQAMQFYVYRRAGYPLEPWFPEMKLVPGDEISDVSSTAIRQRLRNGESITGLVPPRIEEYIHANQLYLKP